MKVISGKLYVIKDLGIQIESHSLGGKVTKKFIDISRVRDIIINEVTMHILITTYVVRYILQCWAVFGNNS